MPNFLESPNLKAFAQLKHAFTTTQLSSDYDRVAQKLKVLSSHIYYLDQTHSGKVVYLGEGMNLRDLGQGDALVTDRKDIYIGVRTADCIPLLVFDPEREVVAAIHAGYRGLLNGIIQNTLRLMTESLKCNPDDLWVALGPSISVENYEVDESLVFEFEKNFGNRFAYRTDLGTKPHLDCKETARLILESCGVDMLHFQDMKLCTFDRDDLFHSFRREKGTGRQFNCIGMVGE